MHAIISQNFLQRMMIGSGLFFLISLAIFFSPNPFFHPLILGLIALFGAGCLRELFSLLEAKGLEPARKTILVFSFLYLIVSYYVQFYEIHLLLALLLLLFSMTLFIHFFFKQKNPTKNIATSFFSFIWITVPLCTAVAILYSPVSEGHGPLWLLFVLITTKSTDIGGYVFGKLFGSHRMAPHLSPNKTWEGAIGGIALCIFSALTFQQFTILLTSFHFTLLQAAVLGAVIAPFALVGDLSESLLKRDAEKKDSSSIPGIGGLLDMFDSLVFTLPLMYIYLNYHHTH